MAKVFKYTDDIDYSVYENNIVYGDCLEAMRKIPDNSIDMILCDLPYGTTACKWDSIIPVDQLWIQYNRIVKMKGAVVLTASQPFTSALIMSNVQKFKYCLVWEKGRASGHVHAKNKPLKAHEDILIFSKGTTVHKNQSVDRMVYNPQMTVGTPYKRTHTSISGSINHAPSKVNVDYIGTETVNSGTRYPRSVLYFSFHNVGNVHPTQKPVALFEYLIKTYTNEGDLVLDSCIGSGTTGAAAINLNRRFIGIEKEYKYCTIAQNRINTAIRRMYLQNIRCKYVEKQTQYAERL